MIRISDRNGWVMFDETGKKRVEAGNGKISLFRDTGGGFAGLACFTIEFARFTALNRYS